MFKTSNTEPNIRDPTLLHPHLYHHLLCDIHSGAVLPQASHRGADKTRTEHCSQVQQSHFVLFLPLRDPVENEE